MTKKKKILVLAIMLVLLVTTAVLNYTIAVGNTDPEEEVVVGNFFTSYRNERIASRNMEIAYLDSIIATEGEEFTNARAEANEQKLKIVGILEKEFEIEYLLKASGFEDAVVTIGITSGNVNVIVKTSELTAQESAIIYTTIYEEAGILPDLIRVTAI